MHNRVITDADIANSKRLRKIWDARKGKLNLTQISAGARLGFNQAMVSQCLNGRVAMNTDHVLKWAQMLGVSPGEIDPTLSSLSFSNTALRQIKVPIIARLSGAAVGAFEAVEISTKMTRQVYGISVDDDSLGSYAKKGSTLIVSQEEEPISGDEVFMRIALHDRHLHIVKQFVMTDTSRGVAVVRDLATAALEEHPLERIEVMDPIVSIEHPIVKRPIRLRPSQANLA